MTRHVFEIIDDNQSAKDRYQIILKLPMLVCEGEYFEFTNAMFKEWTVVKYDLKPVDIELHIATLARQMLFGEQSKAAEALVTGKFAYVINTRSSIDKEGMYIAADIRIVDSKENK